ncbi:hypothetical protein [Pseudonocardia adelaidensis]|uniref:Uncharacterized protein n=1 Tax=Pseudonocardia adelaidensis TaxID=648754 RepID=A0ABP9NRD9_9PSEU
MQLPLSASALVMLGVGAVLVGAVILVVEIARRRKPASRPTRVPPDMRMPQQPAAPSGPYAATAPADGPVAQPYVPQAEPVPAPAAPEPEPAAPPAPQPVAAPEPEPAAPPAPQPVVAPVPAAAPPHPVEVSSSVQPPAGDDHVPAAWTPAAGMPAVPSRSHQAGSGRTVAAAVAQAFAVRAAASRTGASSAQRPVGPPPGADESAVAQPEPERPEPVPTRDVDGVDPAATTDPEGVGLAVPATPDHEVRTPVVDEPGPDVSGNGWVAPVAHGTNGDRPSDAPEQVPDGDGRPPEERQVPEPGSDGEAPAAAAAAGLAAAAWTPPAAPVPADPDPADVPAPRSDEDGVARQDGPAPDARDRLLAVLLDDPERAVGATVELESCLRELDRLSDAVRSERSALRDVLHRLAAAGLRPDQMARLARMPLPEVEALLSPAPAEQQA